MVDHEALVGKMLKFAEDAYVTHVAEAWADAGTEALRALLGAIHDLYGRVPCEQLTDGLVVFVPLGQRPELQLSESSIASWHELADTPLTQATLEVMDNGSLRVWATPIDLDQVPLDCLAYSFRYEATADSIERLVIRGHIHDVPNLSGFPSAFATPTFQSLQEALERFKSTKFASDAHMQRAWRDADRIGFSPAPEVHMRRCLATYLDHVLNAGVSVRPEQNITETEPVDIEVAWVFAGRSALIEVKWMGNSAPPGATTWSTRYFDARALEGATQLVRYLDDFGDSVAMGRMGYLVVFDGRRRAVSPQDVDIPCSKGLHYRFVDVEYPDEYLQRPDFGEPVRVFLNPKCAVGQ